MRGDLPSTCRPDQRALDLPADRILESSRRLASRPQVPSPKAFGQRPFSGRPSRPAGIRNPSRDVTFTEAAGAGSALRSSNTSQLRLCRLRTQHRAVVEFRHGTGPSIGSDNVSVHGCYAEDLPSREAVLCHDKLSGFRASQQKLTAPGALYDWCALGADVWWR